MARTSRTTRIVAEEGPRATGLTIDAAIDSYRLSLRASNKSPSTIKTYLAALAQFSRFLAERGMPRTLRAIRREQSKAGTATSARPPIEWLSSVSSTTPSSQPPTPGSGRPARAR